MTSQAQNQAPIRAGDGAKFGQLAAYALFAVQPSDRALTGWGIGDAPGKCLQALAYDPEADW